MPTAERVFRAMGSDCRVLIVVPDYPHAGGIAEDLVSLAVERIEILEDCWSRFRPGGELSRLNAAAGRGPQQVSEDLFVLVDHMATAWRASGNRFDPTVLSSMITLGYDADFASVVARGAVEDVVVAASPGMRGVVLDAAARTVELPVGVGIDPGAIGKGLGADIVAAESIAAGAAGALVNLGGDLAFAGSAADGAPWRIGVEDERCALDHPARMHRVLEFPSGPQSWGVATSSTAKRRWAQGRRHHVIDPRTGTMADSDLVQATVVAGDAWLAEVCATTALLMGSEEASAWLRARELGAILLTRDSVISTIDEVSIDD